MIMFHQPGQKLWKSGIFNIPLLDSTSSSPQMLHIWIIYLHLGEKWPHSRGKWLGKYSHPITSVGNLGYKCAKTTKQQLDQSVACPFSSVPRRFCPFFAVGKKRREVCRTSHLFKGKNIDIVCQITFKLTRIGRHVNLQWTSAWNFKNKGNHVKFILNQAFQEMYIGFGKWNHHQVWSKQ